MNEDPKIRIMFIALLIGILTITIMSTFRNPITIGKIEKLDDLGPLVLIKLENQTEKVVLFEEQIPEKLKISKKIAVYGNQDEYEGQLQIIAEKIILLE
jgi:hypothetical protein